MRGAGPQHKDALIEGIREVMGISCTLDGIETSGRLDRDLLTAMLDNAGVSQSQRSKYFVRVVEAAQHHYSVHCRTDFSTKLCPGVLETLHLLAKRNVPMGLVTGNLSAIAWRKLENARIAHHFAVGSFAEEGKTRHRLAQLAVFKARRQGIAHRHCSVTVIGDHANDISAAKFNRYRSVAVATGIMQRHQLSEFEPDLILDTLEGATFETICGVK